MREIFFVFKTFLATLLLVLLLQIKLGDDTLEVKALSGLRQSAIATTLQEFGNDGWAAFRKLASKGSHSLGSFFSSKEDRSGIFKMHRSQAFKDELEEKKNAIEAKAEKFEKTEKEQLEKKLSSSKKTE